MTSDTTMAAGRLPGLADPPLCFTARSKGA